MRQTENSILQNLDWKCIGLYLALIFIGMLNVYSVSFDEAHPSLFYFGGTQGKQLIWILISLFIGFCILLTEPRFFSQTAYIFYGVGLVLLVAVLATATATKGAKSWFGIGAFGIQPSEFAKFTTSLALARYLGGLGVDLKEVRVKAIAFALILIPMGLVFLQNDTGSTLVFCSLFLVLFREGLSGKLLLYPILLGLLIIGAYLFGPYIMGGVVVVGLAGSLLFSRKTKKDILNRVFLLAFLLGIVFVANPVYEKVLAQHQKDRIDILFGKTEDLKKTGYNVNQSKIAIGSGGFLGKGYLQGTQTQYNFVPEQSTDFIFCTIGEEWGFVGSAITIVVYIFFFIHLITMAERQRSRFARIYGYCLASILFFHFAVNIGMTISLFPVMGIPLPFISYGGSSLLAFTMFLFVFIRQDASRNNLI